MYFREPAREANNFPPVPRATLNGMRSKRVVFCVLRALQADFSLRATGSLLAFMDFTRSADDAPSSDNP